MHRLPLSAKTAARRVAASSLIALKTPALAAPRASSVPSVTFTLTLTRPTRRHLTMDAKELSSYLADSPPTVVRLEIAKHFDALTDRQKRYAHYISK